MGNLVRTARSSDLIELIASKDRAWVTAMVRNLPFLADLIPADLFICCPKEDGKLIAVAEARPTVRESFYRRSLIGSAIPLDQAALYQAFRSGDIAEGPAGKVVSGQPMHQRVYPIRYGRKVCAVLVVERNLYEEFKHTAEKRHLYRTAVERAVTTLLKDSRTKTGSLHPAGAGDAMLILNASSKVRHASHQAAAFARRWGLPESLEGLTWSETFPARGELREIPQGGLCREFELTGRKQALAIRILSLEPADDDVGALVVLRDTTELREKDRELAVKETIIREVHHRVKNNLQTIAGLLRLQIRRSGNAEVKEILTDCIDRISSIAVVHEYLAHDDVGAVDIKELCFHLLKAAIQSSATPELAISSRLISSKDRLTLPSAKATAVALVVNELLANACKHAYRGRQKGVLDLVLDGRDNEVAVNVRDDGCGMPEGYDPGEKGHLGWHIVRHLVIDDLHGTLHVDSSPSGTNVQLTIPQAQRNGQ